MRLVPTAFNFISSINKTMLLFTLQDQERELASQQAAARVRIEQRGVGTSLASRLGKGICLAASPEDTTGPPPGMSLTLEKELKDMRADYAEMKARLDLMEANRERRGAPGARLAPVTEDPESEEGN